MCHYTQYLPHMSRCVFCVYLLFVWPHGNYFLLSYLLLYSSDSVSDDVVPDVTQREANDEPVVLGERRQRKELKSMPYITEPCILCQEPQEVRVWGESCVFPPVDQLPESIPIEDSIKQGKWGTVRETWNAVLHVVRIFCLPILCRDSLIRVSSQRPITKWRQ